MICTTLPAYAGLHRAADQGGAAERCPFGTEKQGTGSAKDPATGRWVDDIHLLIEGIEWLDDAERDQVFAGNAQQLFKL